MYDEGTSVLVKYAKSPWGQSNTVSRMHHRALAILDLNIDEISHVVGVIYI